MRLRSALLPLLIIAIAGTGFIYLKNSRPQQNRPEIKEKEWQIDVVAVSPTALAPELAIFASVEAPQQLTATAPAAAVVTAIYTHEGAKVRAGDLLLTLDERDFNPRLAAAAADVADLKAQISQLSTKQQFSRQALIQEQTLLELARAALSRAKSLQKQNLVSDQSQDEAQQAVVRQELALAQRQLEVDNYPASLAQLQARLQRAESSLAEATLAMERSRIVAPYDATIASLAVAVGERVQAQQQLLELYQVTTLELRARLADRYLQPLSNALMRDIPITARGENGLILTLRQISGKAEPGAFDALFQVSAAGESLKPGSLQAVTLTLPPREHLFALPPQALYGSETIYQVIDGRLQPLTVEVVGNLHNSDNNSQILVQSSDPLTFPATMMVTHLPNASRGLKVKVNP
ncbi:MAG: HlyD family efflux transporter periplasmic adaptor subunit [Gammaproteobacteria bacterium]|nr:HlyD family efflux transporter periplasmic adaptor subunit [Gammaproteobacteria bacterium]